LSNNDKSLESSKVLGFLKSSGDPNLLLLLGGFSLRDDLVYWGSVGVAVTEGAEVADVVGGCRGTGKTGPVKGLIVDHLSGAHAAGDPAVVVLIRLIYHLGECMALRTTECERTLCIMVIVIFLEVMRVVLSHSKFEFFNLPVQMLSILQQSLQTLT
jgi:hypothetical protein